MHRPLAQAQPAAPRPWRLALAAGLLSSLATITLAGEPDALAKAQGLVKAGDARAAARLLESALTSADASSRPAILGMLPAVYEKAAAQAEKDGQAAEAAGYRESLDILRLQSPAMSSPANRSPIPAPAGQPSETTAAEPTPAPELLPPSPLPAPRQEVAETGPAPIENEPSEASPPAPQINEGSATSPTAPARRTVPPPEVPATSDAEPQAAARSTDPARERLARAAAAFKNKRYAEAKIHLDKLAQDGQLPPEWRECWAYCRWHAVVSRINARPQSKAEWAALRDEVEQIGRLMPNHWFDGYLKDYIAERLGHGYRPQGPSDKVVVRAASPEESPPPRTNHRPTRPAPAPRVRGQSPATPDAGVIRAATPGAPAAIDTPEPAPAAEMAPDPFEIAPSTTTSDSPAASAPAGEVPRGLVPASTPPDQPATSPGDGFADPDLAQWRRYATANFRIYHHDPELARRIGEAAEAAREAQVRRWTGEEPRGGWSPPCEIYIYPNARIFSERTQQPPDSPGFSTSGLMAGRVTARRINLRADHPKIVEAILPHEVTHIVLAELFPIRQIPRWADEGIAVLSEPEAEQQERATDLNAPLNGGRIFNVDQLMVMDYPEGQYWPLYYAQSISLTRYLVGLATPARFVEFVRDSQQLGPEAALRKHYQIESYADLQARWIDYARSTTGTSVATAPAGDATGRLRQE